MFPSTLVILNIFETNTVNSCEQLFVEFLDSQSAVTKFIYFIANRTSDMSEMLLEIRSSRPTVFCKNEIL